MKPVFIILIVFVCFLLLLVLIELLRRKLSKKEIVTEESVHHTNGVCCGRHEICEHGLTRPTNHLIEYYDDEELDAFKGIASNAYTPEQVSLFEEIFQTMQPADVQGWLCSLQSRGIALPDSLVSLLRKN